MVAGVWEPSTQELDSGGARVGYLKPSLKRQRGYLLSAARDVIKNIEQMNARRGGGALEDVGVAPSEQPLAALIRGPISLLRAGLL